MHREIHNWYSPALGKEMEIVIYGNYGDALLLLPTAGADYLEYERFHMIDAISHCINAGKFKVFSINSINNESWLNRKILPHHKMIRHEQFNHYVSEEVVPFIKSHTSQETLIFVSGASLGAFHSANLFFKYPDRIAGVIAMSGIYDLTYYADEFWNNEVYFNSPTHYLKDLNDPWYLEKIKASRHIHFVTGSGAYEDPGASVYITQILGERGIPHTLDVWGWDMPHDWTTWRQMLPYYLEQKF